MPDTDFFLQPEAEPSNFVKNEPEVRIPVIAEFLSVDKAQMETGSVHIAKHVSEHTETVDISLQSVDYVIEHVAKNEFVDEGLPAARQEGDTMVIPVLKEVMVKRMLLVEEVRITKQTTQRNEQQDITLRSESVEVTRTPIIVSESQTRVKI